jgi:hypothetical protein
MGFCALLGFFLHFFKFLMIFVCLFEVFICLFFWASKKVIFWRVFFVLNDFLWVSNLHPQKYEIRPREASTASASPPAESARGCRCPKGDAIKIVTKNILTKFYILFAKKVFFYN